MLCRHTLKIMRVHFMSSFTRYIFLSVIVSGLLSGGCVRQKPAVREMSAIAHPSGIEEEADHGCSYFYFLSGRYAELAAKYDEALEAYEKALICDPGAEYIERKIPLLLLYLNHRDEAISRLKDFIERHPDESSSRMLLAKVFIREKKLREAGAQYRKVHELMPDDTTSLLLLSELYLIEGKQDLAGDTLEDVLQIDNQSYAAHVLLARLLVAQKEYDKAVEHYQLALEINWSSELQLEMAERFLRQKKYDKAESLYQDLLDRDEFNEDARVALIHVYLQQNREKQALAEWNRLKSITSRPERVDITIARLYIRKKEYVKAISILEDVLSRKDNGEVRYLLAFLHYQTGQYEETLLDLKGIPHNSEEYEDGIFLQVQTLRKLKREEEAIGLLESVIAKEQGRNPEMYVLLASLYQLEKNEKLGRETFVRGIKSYPDDDNLLYEYGLYLDYQGKQQQALDVMQKVIKLQPEHAAALNYVGYTWADKKIKLDKALAYIKKAVELKPDNGYIRDSLGWVYYRQGKLDLSIQTLQQAVQLSPDDPAILDHLADVYLESGRVSDALQTYRKALALYKDDPEGAGRIREKIRILEEQESK